MHAVLFDEHQTWQELLPLTFTRPVPGIRFGILTIAEKWEKALGKPPSFMTQSHLAPYYAGNVPENSIFINGAVCPDASLLPAISNLQHDQALYAGDTLIACYGDQALAQHKSHVTYSGSVLAVNRITDIFTKNGEALSADFAVITRDRRSVPLSESVTVIGDPELVFLEDGAKAEACIFNTTSGPIYLGKDSEVMEGSAIRGPFSLGEHSTVKMNAKIYGATTVGPHCKVGGEINNSVIFGFSNKAHDGFLGNSVIGEWCNLGADTNNSNLKNNYGNVKIFSYRNCAPVDTGLQFCGLIMGDHSKCGINTMFNTGTVVGVGANIFGGGFPPTHIPSFRWGGNDGFDDYRIDKLFETEARVYGRRGMAFSEADKTLLRTIQEMAARYNDENNSLR